MTKEIWTGPVLGSNREPIIARCAELVARGLGHTFIYLAASAPLLELVTGRLLDGERNRGLWGPLPVHLFRGFIRHVLATSVDAATGKQLSPRVPIDVEQLPLKRALIAELIRRLMASGNLSAIKPLALREGSINTIAAVIGEIERAGKSPDEFAAIVRSREIEDVTLSETAGEPDLASSTAPRQIDLDRDISLIYSAYASALERFQLTDEDADQLLALQVLRSDRGLSSEKRYLTPWLEDVRLLVLDGFFDFTPVQGEILRLLIPSIPDVIVNINLDNRNPEIFRPFRETLDQLMSMVKFDLRTASRFARVSSRLDPLRNHLFNPLAPQIEPQAGPDGSSAMEDSDADGKIRLIECGDRETELREIAREIKRLIRIESYRISDIALVVRERASYAETIVRVFKDEAIACNLGRRVSAVEIPAVRAALKLFRTLGDLSRAESRSPKAAELADLIKSGYFRAADQDLSTLRARFDREYGRLLSGRSESGSPGRPPGTPELPEGIRRWDPDEIENVIAYVGSELRIDRWLRRARSLVDWLPNREILETVFDEMSPAEPLGTLIEQTGDEAGSGNAERAEEVPTERRPPLLREVHPAAIAWAMLVVEHLSNLLKAVPLEAEPTELRVALRRTLEQLQFANQIRRRAQRDFSVGAGPDIALDLRGLEAIRRSFVAGVKSIQIASEVVPFGPAQSPSSESGAAHHPERVKLSAFLDGVHRCLSDQSLVISGADRDGLQVLEATDVRGLRFKAIFVAGLIEGGFPLRVTSDWLYPHEERERLKHYGLTLEDISPATLLKEEHYFYQAVCRATERLYLTRPLVLEDGSETVASYYIEELRRAISPEAFERQVIHRDYEGHAISGASTPAELAMLLVRLDERHLHPAGLAGLPSRESIRHTIERVVRRAFISSSALNRVDIERERAGLRFGPFDGEITVKPLVDMLSERFGPRHTFSASRLGVFGKCPYRFLADQVLALKPRGEAALDLSALDAGRLLHEALRRFFEKHQSEDMTTLGREKLRNELSLIADEVFDQHERMVPPLNLHIWKIDRENRKVLLDQVLLYELSVQEATRAKRVRPALFELAFGMSGDEDDPRSKSQRLELDRAGATANDEPIRLRGRIDRVDVAADGTAVAYDYKLSSGSSIEDMKTGRDLQVGIYLEALEKVLLPGTELAGGGYYTIRGGRDRRNAGLYRKSFGEYTGIRGTNSNLEDDEWQAVRAEMIERIFEFVDRMRLGQFHVIPSRGKATCATCDFSAICRYDTFRIREKVKSFESRS